MSHGLARGRQLSAQGHGLALADLPPFDQGRIDPRTWFEHPDRRLEIEIGSGKGTFLIQQALAAPEVNLLGIESAGEFYRYAADRLRRKGLANARILYGDAVEFLRFWCADQAASVIHLYFSDPWPKKRHHKRRVVQDATMAEFHRVLRSGESGKSGTSGGGGELRLITDHDELWTWYEDHAARHAHLFERREFDRPVSAGANEIVGTNFERKYRREGRPFHAMTLSKRTG